MKTNLTPKKQHRPGKSPKPELAADTSVPFIEHLYELRRRLIYMVGSVLVFSTAAYFVQQQIVNFLLRPSKGQQFIYTSPGGGINFLFSVCMYVGVAASIPVIIYQVLGFFAPLTKAQTRRLLIRYSAFSCALAVCGFCFGYFIGLPAALHFLSNQFTTKQVHPLFTIQEYMNFLMIYLLGAALLFQLPIILLFINRIRPLPPRKLLGAERYVIVLAFIIAMIMAPTPNVINQLIIVVPIILMYNVSILLIWRTNRYGLHPEQIAKLLEQDRMVQTDRLQKTGVRLPVEPLASEPAQRPQPSRRRLAINQLSGASQAVTVRWIARPSGSH